VELWSESGISKQEYSIEIKYKAFLNWVYHFGTKTSPSKVSAESFIAIEVDSLSKNSRDEYSSTIKILYPNGIQLILIYILLPIVRTNSKLLLIV
jgi:hypothetical protein